MSTVVETMPERIEAAIQGHEVKPVCRHHWVIDPPNGSVSRGVCKFCGEERSFNNSAERYLIKRR